MSGKSVRKQRGVALLVVLILLVMMSALAAKIASSSAAICRKPLSGKPAAAALGHSSQQKTIEGLLQTYASGDSGSVAQGSGQSRWSTEGEHYTVSEPD